MSSSSEIEALIEQARADEEVLAVVLYGSVARGEAAPNDTDVCLVLRQVDSVEPSAKRLEYLSRYDLDIHTFQGLPLPIRQRVLGEGRILLSKDEDALYELASETIRANTYFRRAYETYLEGVKAGS